MAVGERASAQVDTSVPLASDSGVATVESEGFSGGVSLNGTYFDIRHQAFSGVGYQDGFTQFGAFRPFWGSDNWYIAPNGRFLLGNDAATGFNAGLVGRVYNERFDRIFGANAYYDYDQSQYGNRYGQVGFGLETLGKYFDFRANAYLPTSTDANFVRATGLSDQLVFFGNQLGFLGTQLVESSLRGGDFEVGVPVTPSTPWLRAYAGAYAYEQDAGDEPIGFRGRLEGWVTNDLSLGLMVTQDNQFGTNVNAIIDWRFAGFQPTRYFPNWSTRDRMLMPVQRHWRVTAGTYEETTNIAAQNPGDTNDYFVVWVDPDRGTAEPGTGTFEDPFNRLPVNIPAGTDLVLVTRGDTTQANPLLGTFNLPDRARMLGEGQAHIIDATLTATFGGFTQTVNNALLPDARFRDTGLYPFLSSPGNIVNVSNGNEVAAFVMNGAGGAAIAGTNVNGFHFHNLEIANNAGGGIVLTGAGGTGLVTPDGQSILSGRIADINRNVVPGWLNPDGRGNNGGPGGIAITTGIATLDLELARVSMNATPGGQAFGVRLITAQGGLNLIANDVSTSGGNTVAGMSIEQGTGAINAALDTINASDNNGIGLRLLSGNLRPMIVTGNNITANGNAGDNLFIGGGGNSTFTGTFTNSTFDGSTGGAGVSLNGMVAGTKTLSLTNVSASGNAAEGVRLGATGGTLNFVADTLTANNNGTTAGDNFNATLSNTIFTGSAVNSFFDGSVTGSGLTLDMTGGRATLLLDTISSSNNAAHGLNLGAHGGAQVGTLANAALDGVNVIDSTLTGNGLIGINQLADGGSRLEVFVDPTDVSGNGLHAIRYEVTGGSAFVANYDQVDLDNSGQVAAAVDPSAVGGRGRGLFGLVDGVGTTSNVLLQNATIQGGADDGVFLGASNQAVANLTLSGVTILDNGVAIAGASGVEVSGATGSTVTLSTDATTVVGNTNIGGPTNFGLRVTSNDVGTVVNTTSTGTTFDNARANAVNATVNGGQSTITMTNTTGNFAGGTGLAATVAGAGFLTLDLDNADFLSAGQIVAGDGLNALVSGGSLLNACILNSEFDGASRAGIRFTSTGAGSETNVHLESGSASNNTQGGLVAGATAGGDLNLRTVGFAFDNNGTAGALDFDGVFVRADGAGSAARLLFNTTSADNNSRHGFNFEAAGGAFMTARIDSVSAQGNGGFGVRLDAQNAGTNAFLLPSGTNTVAGNGLGSYSVSYTGTDTAIIGLDGSFNGLGTDGVRVDIANVGTAIVSLTGNGTDTINSNAGDGVDIRITNADQAGIRIAGYQSISSNTEDGIHLELTNIATAAAIDILGPTALTDNGDDGIDILLNNVALGTFTAPPGLDPLSVITLTDNDPLNDCVPEPVGIPFNSVVIVPTANGILIDQQTITRTGGAPAAGQNGIDINGTNVTGAGQIVMTNNTITNYDNGINGSFAGGGTFGGVVVDATTIDQSSARGINLAYNASGSPISIANTAITNSGGTGLNIGLTGAIGGGDITIDATTVSDSGGGGVAITGGGVLGDISLTGVSTTNSLGGRGINIDLAGGSVNSVTVNGQGTATVTNSGADGLFVQLNGVGGVPAISVGNYAQIDNNAGHGLAVIATGTNVGAIDLSNNTVTNSTAGNGILLQLDSNIGGDVTVANNTVDQSFNTGINLFLDGANGGANVNVSNSTVTNSGLAGVSLSGIGATLGDVTFLNTSSTISLAAGLEANLTNATLGDLTIDTATVDQSNGNSVDITLGGATMGNVSLTDVTVTNSGLRGVSLSGTGAVTTVGDVTLTNVSSDTTGTGEGIAVLFDTAGTSVGAINLTGVSANLSGAGGILVDLNGISVGSPIALTGGANSFSTNNNGDGIRVNLTNLATVADVSVTGYQLGGAAGVDNNAGHGIAVVGSGTTQVGTVDISSNNVDNSTAGNGIHLDLTNLAVTGPVTLDSNNVDNSFGDGIRLALDGVTGGADVSTTNSDIDNSGAIGINLTAVGATLGTVLLDPSTVNNSGLDGVRLDLQNATVADVRVEDFTISNSGLLGTGVGDGLEINADGLTSPAGITVLNTTVTNSESRGVHIHGNAAPLNLGDITLTNVSSTTTTNQEGVFVEFSNGTIGSVNLNNVSATDSGATGIRVVLGGALNVGPTVSIDGQGTAVANDNGGSGITLTLSNVVGTPDVTVTGYNSVDNNGASGIRVLSNNSPVGAVTVSDNTVSNSQGGDGISINLTGNAVGSLLVDNNAISNSNARGLDVVLDNVTGGPAVTVTNTTSNVSGNRGISIQGNAATLGNVTLTDVSSDTTAADNGVSLVLTNGTVGTISFNNVSANNSAATGILVDLNTETVTSPISLTGGPASFSTNNGGDGIFVNLINVVGTPNVSVTDYNQVSDNNGNGIHVVNTGTPVGTVDVSRNTITNSTNGDGILLDLSNQVGGVLADNNTVTGSSNNGINVQLTGVTGAPDVTISNSTVDASTGGDGIRVFTNGSVLNDILIDTATVSNSNIDGIAVIDLAGSTINSIVLNQVNSDTTTLGNGVSIQLTNTTGLTNVAVQGGGTITNSAFDGIGIVLNGVTGTPDVTVDGYTVSTSGNGGIFIDTNAVPVDDVTVANNTVSDSATTQGIAIDLTGSAVGSVLVDTNTITNSGTRGLDLILNGVTGLPTVTVADTTSQNSGGRGISVSGTGSAATAIGDVTLTNVSSDTTTAEEGVMVEFNTAGATVGAIALNNVSATSSFATGIQVDLNAVTVGASVNVDGQGTAVSSNNGTGAPGDGIFVNLTNVLTAGGPPNVNVNIDNYATISTNSNNGIALIATATNVGDVSVSNNVDINNSGAAGSGGTGILVNLAGNNVGSVLVDSNLVDTSDGRGVDVVLDNVTGAPVIAVSNTTVTNSGGRGISVSGTGATLGDVQLTFVSSDTTTAEDGVVVALDNGTVDSVLLNDVSASNSFGGGILVDLNTMNVGSNVTVDGQGNAQVTGNGGDGILVTLNTLTPAATLDVNIDNFASVANNGGRGVALVSTATPLDNISASGNSINNNTGGNGLTVDLTGSNATDITIHSNVIGTNAGEGVFISQTNSNVGPIFIGTDSAATTGLGNTISGNTLNGINLAVANSSQGVVTFMENQITGHTGGDGVNLVQLDDTDGTLDFNFLRNSITGNSGGRGVNFTLPATTQLNTVLNASFTNDTISSNGQEGILVDLTADPNANVTANITILSDNATANPVGGAFNSDISSNGGMGVFINADSTSDIVLSVGGNGDVNTFDGNQDAGIGILLAENATGTTGAIGITNASFTNTTNGANASFNGDGIAVFISDNATFDNATIGDAVLDNTSMTGNAGSGFILTTNGLATSDSLTIQHANISNNTGNGLTFIRNANVPVPGTYISNVTIDSNTINENQRGIDISATFANGADSYTITNNTIDSNRRTGIRMFMGADADLNVTIGGAAPALGNRITNNGTANVGGDNDGIQVTENLGPTDVGVIISTIANNTITGNRNNGINVIALHTLDINNNDISNNVAGDGITITGASTNDGATPTVNNIAFNAINENGNNGITLTAIGVMNVNIHDNNSLVFGGRGGVRDNGGDGIQLNATAGILGFFGNTATIDDNDITNNAGDGVQLLVSGTGANNLQANNVVIVDNNISDSGRRGINVLNASDSRTNLTVNTNLVDRSTLEGVYIVNTSTTGTLGAGSGTVQGIDALADTAMAASDSFLSDPRLALNMNTNTITSNGQAANGGQLFDATGFVLRVGTSDASNATNDNGGFASNFASTAAFQAAAGGGLTVGNMSRGGVVASVVGNGFGGQFGSDVTFQGYNSTTAPPVTGGAWNDNNNGDSTAGPPVPRNPGNDVFNPTGYVSDPLARLDLRFTNTNTGDSLIATRTDVFGGTNPAFYNTAEPIFKSRTAAQDGNDPPVGGPNQSNVQNGDDGGPFTSATRRRNAIRQASNAAPFNTPDGMGSIADISANGFLYPGVGASTFRLTTDTSGGGFTTIPAGSGFGSNVPFAGAVTGELPFVWGAIP